MRLTHARWLAAGLAVLAVTAVQACGNSYSPTSPGGGSADVTLTIVGMSGANSYSPNPGIVPVGKTVAWRNADAITHTATSDTGAFDTGAIAPGTTSAPIRMPNAASYPYHCSIHPTMTGTVLVQ